MYYLYYTLPPGMVWYMVYEYVILVVRRVHEDLALSISATIPIVKNGYLWPIVPHMEGVGGCVHGNGTTLNRASARPEDVVG